MNKEHKGSITGWFKQGFDVADTKKKYNEDPGLGFIIQGRFVNHPYLTGFGHTSWVTKYEEQPDGTVEIETRNSRYTLEKKE